MAAWLRWLGVALELGVLLALAVRRGGARVLLLAPWLVAVAASTAVIGLCPSCNTWGFWISKEFVDGVLTFALGIELAWRAFTPHTASRRVAMAWSLSVAVVLLVAPRGASLIDAPPVIAAATAWLYGGLTLLMLLAAWRGSLAPDALPRTLLAGFAFYTMFYAVTWSRTGDDTTIAGLANPIVFNLVMVLVLRAAWQRAPPSL